MLLNSFAPNLPHRKAEVYYFKQGMPIMWLQCLWDLNKLLRIMQF